MEREIRIGKKSVGVYTESVIFSFSDGCDSVKISALGSGVSKAFDTAENAVQTINIEKSNVETFERGNTTGVKIELKKGESP